jgi:hypothetical protein
MAVNSHPDTVRPGIHRRLFLDGSSLCGALDGSCSHLWPLGKHSRDAASGALQEPVSHLGSKHLCTQATHLWYPSIAPKRYPVGSFAGLSKLKTLVVGKTHRLALKLQPELVHA